MRNSALTKEPFEPVAQISVKFLLLKMAFLLAITTARRVSDLQALTIKEPFLLLLEDRVILKQDPLFLPKVTSNFHRSQEIILPSFCQNPKNERGKIKFIRHGARLKDQRIFLLA